MTPAIGQMAVSNVIFLCHITSVLLMQKIKLEAEGGEVDRMVLGFLVLSGKIVLTCLAGVLQKVPAGSAGSNCSLCQALG